MHPLFYLWHSVHDSILTMSELNRVLRTCHENTFQDYFDSNVCSRSNKRVRKFTVWWRLVIRSVHLSTAQGHLRKNQWQFERSKVAFETAGNTWPPINACQSYEHMYNPFTETQLSINKQYKFGHNRTCQRKTTCISFLPVPLTLTWGGSLKLQRKHKAQWRFFFW